MKNTIIIICSLAAGILSLGYILMSLSGENQQVSEFMVPETDTLLTTTDSTKSDKFIGHESSVDDEERIAKRLPAGYIEGAFSIHQSNGQSPPSEFNEVQSAVDRVTGVVKATNSERFRAVAELYDIELSKMQERQLLDYLADFDRNMNMSRYAFYVLVNEIVRVFHDKEKISNDYLETSKEVISNIHEKEVVRDYVLQGLSHSMRNATVEQASFITEVFWGSIHEDSTSLAGTAMLALRRERLAKGFSAEEDEALREVAINYLKDPDVDERTRISAIQIAGMYHDDQSYRALLAISESDKLTSSEKLAVTANLRNNMFSVTK